MALGIRGSTSGQRRGVNAPACPTAARVRKRIEKTSTGAPTSNSGAANEGDPGVGPPTDEPGHGDRGAGGQTAQPERVQGRRQPAQLRAAQDAQAGEQGPAWQQHEQDVDQGEGGVTEAPQRPRVDGMHGPDQGHEDQEGRAQGEQGHRDAPAELTPDPARRPPPPLAGRHGRRSAPWPRSRHWRSPWPRRPGAGPQTQPGSSSAEPGGGQRLGWRYCPRVSISQPLRPQVRHHCQDLLLLLAQPQHQPRLGRHPRVACLEGTQQLERAMVIRPRPGLAVEPRHRFQVVVEDIGDRHSGKLGQRDGLAPSKVRHQDLQPGLGRACPNRTQAAGEVPSPAVAQVIAVHRGDDDVAQRQARNRLRQLLRLRLVRGLGPPMGHVAEGAAAGADIPQNHEGRGAVTEALAQVGALCLLADCGQPLLSQQPLDPHHRGPDRSLGPDPFGLAQRRRAGLDLDRDARDLVPPPLVGLGGDAGGRSQRERVSHRARVLGAVGVWSGIVVPVSSHTCRPSKPRGRTLPARLGLAGIQCRVPSRPGPSPCTATTAW